MRRIEIEIMHSSETLDTVVDTWHIAEKGGGTTIPRISFGSIKDLFSAITEKRLELLRFAADQPGLNTRQLAQALERDYKNVYTDVRELEELGIIEKDEDGKLTVPYDEIVIHAGLTEAA